MPKRLLSLVGPLVIAAFAILYLNRADLLVPDFTLPEPTSTQTQVDSSASTRPKTKAESQVSTGKSTSTSVAEPAVSSTQATTSEKAIVKTNAQVVRVVDGDTLVAKLDAEPDVEYKIRLLGVNTPETVDPRRAVQCYGKQASDFAKKSLSDKRVRLEADPKADERDKYNRLLRNLILEDGTDFNATLVSEGYANAYLSFPLNAARKVELRKLEGEAKAAKKGLWATDACN